MEFIRTDYRGDRQQPLENAKGFVLAKCGNAVNAEQYKRCSVRGEGPIIDADYIVDIAVDGDEVYACFHWPSTPRWPVLEITFFRETTTTPSTNHAA